jgi:hypothetical protein
MSSITKGAEIAQHRAVYTGHTGRGTRHRPGHPFTMLVSDSTGL